MKKKLFITLLLSTFCLCTNAYETYNIPQTSNPTLQINVYSPSEVVNIGEGPQHPAFPVTQDYINPVLLSGQNWINRIEASPLTPVIYSYTSIDDYNAAAGSPYVNVIGKPYKYTIVDSILNNLTIDPTSPALNMIDGNGIIMVGLGTSEEFPGWQPYSGKHALYHGELPDLYAVMTHEFMHSLGVSSNVDTHREELGDKNYYFSESLSDPISIFDSQLRIYTATTAPTNVNNFLTNELMPTNGQKIGEGAGEYDIDNYSPYFIGENAIKVLGDSEDYDTARQKIIDNGGLVNYSGAYDGEEKPQIVYGLPIHPYDGFGIDKEYELSHIELRNSYMSHQDYRNWLTPMEAELALLNDIGYNIPLRKYFGKSYYLNGVTESYNRGFSEWNGTEYTQKPSTVDLAVGIHIYGDNNDITQNSNILTNGEGSVGVRIDGVNNTYTLESGNIHTNGKENLGIAATWGSLHKINVKSGTEVTATGKDGIAASFDFGANLFGTADSDIKGSYISYSDEKSGDPDDSIQGPLVSEFNVEGTLTGSKAAIYISDNAYVDEINIKDGAKINGDIISDWNSVASADKARVMIEDGENWRPTNTDNPAEMYHTYLNVDAPNGVEINGNIIGDQKYYNTLKMSNSSGSKLDYNGTKIDVNSFENFGKINIKNDTSIKTFEDKIEGDGDINIVPGASLNLSGNITTVENSLNFDNASFKLSDNTINSVNLTKMSLSGSNSMEVDVDMNTLTSDKITFNDADNLTVNSGASLDISKVNLMNANKTFTNKKYYIPFVSSADNNLNLLGNVNYAGRQNIMTPIFKYNLGYIEDATQGGFAFSRGATKKYGSYNPAIVASSVAAQFGGYLTQLNSYEHAFQNLDMRMLMSRQERQAYKYANKYASSVTPMVYSPTYLPDKNVGGWFRPYATFEKVGLKNGPKVESIGYGSYFGGDSPIYETKKGWDFQYSVYAGYNGSHQNYSGNSIYQNGGTLGATAIWYKNDFFTALTANVGAGVADASTMYGSEDFAMLMTGVASKTGYNWELAKGKFIIQPSYMMSYSFVNTFDYTNAAGVRIKSDPLNAINIAPGLKFIGNLKNGWQPYIGIQMVWNIMDKTDFRANNVALPDMSVKPYFQYGVGIQKRWGERFTGFFQSMIRNGGRNGIALTLGFRWAIGK